MPTAQLSALLDGIASVPSSIDMQLTGLTLDSRSVKPGDLFCAVPGTQMDGRQFIEEVWQKGASAVVAEGPAFIDGRIFYVPGLKDLLGTIAARFYQHPARSLQMIGVTGTSGKTSCSQWIAAALQQAGASCGIIGTMGHGFYGNLRPGQLTTPDAFSLQKTLADLKEQGAGYVAMEVSSHSLDQGRVKNVPFKIGIFTNLSHEHLDYHGTMAAYGAAKKKLFDQPDLSHAIINADDAFGQSLIETLNPTQSIYTYSLAPLKIKRPNIYVKEILTQGTQTEAQVVTPWGAGQFQTECIGHFNISNLLAVLTTLCLLEFPLKDALSYLSQLRPVPGRMQRLGGGQRPQVIIDYSHKPEALQKVLQALRPLCQGKLFCIFGCGGDRDKTKRPKMANIAEQWADEVWVTNDNPRTESPEQIIADIMQGFNVPERVKIRYDRAECIREALSYAQKNDCILIAGKGTEEYQLIGRDKIPFSDEEEVKKCLFG